MNTEVTPPAGGRREESRTLGGDIDDLWRVLDRWWPGARPRLGDLVATCSSPLSRNRTFGERLGQGMTTEEIYASTRQVAEGAKSCSSLRALAASHGVDAPIAEHVDDVVAGRLTTQEMMNSFIARDTKPELH